MRSLNVIEYRVNKHDEQIEHIRKHNDDVNASLVVINENLSSINKSLKEEVEKAKETEKRIFALEDDLKVRTTEKNHLKHILVTWPNIMFKIAIAVFVVISLFSQLDYSKTQVLLRHFMR